MIARHCMLVFLNKQSVDLTKIVPFIVIYGIICVILFHYSLFVLSKKFQCDKCCLFLHVFFTRVTCKIL